MLPDPVCLPTQEGGKIDVAGRKRLILIKHSEPSIDPGAPPNTWGLSEEGRRRSATLAARLRPYGPDVVLTSEEPKATETARIVAGRLGLEFAIHPRLHEHDRTGAPFGTKGDFVRSARVFFENPEELVWSNETAEQAGERFSGAVDEILERYPHRDVAVVTHGTVITLFVALLSRFDQGYSTCSGYTGTLCLGQKAEGARRPSLLYGLRRTWTKGPSSASIHSLKTTAS